ncbi:MAG TPA: methyltransferase domain-containing protein [bacterium]|nr:methyltransferase domain-containing protein [bacterium]
MKANSIAPASEIVQEWMDDPACPEERLRPDLGALGRMNRLTGAVHFVCTYLDRLLPVWRRSRTLGAPLVLLDVATGGADIPRAVVRWAARRDVPVRIVAIDRHPVTARLAAQSSVRFPEIEVVRADARALPFRDGAFDACLCSIALHHLEPAERPALVGRLNGLGRLGFFVVDLVRSPAAHAGVWLLTRCFLNPLIRTDGPRSVDRAYTWTQYRELAATAGVPNLSVRRVPGFRVALERLG